MKKAFVAFLSLLLLLCLLLPTGATETAFSLVVGTCTADPGGQASLTLSLLDNPGLVGMELRFAYDEDLTLLGVSLNDGYLTAVGGGSGLADDPASISLCPPGASAGAEGKYLIDRANNFCSDGALLTLTFAVAADAEPGKICPVSVSYVFAAGNDYDAEGNEVYGNQVVYTPALVTGSVTVHDTRVSVNYVADGVSTVARVQPGTIQLAAAPETAHTFIGWSDGNDLYPAGAAFTVAGGETFTAMTLEMQLMAGASVRTIPSTADTNESGIRFVSYVGEQEIAALIRTAESLELGSLVIPTDYLTGTYTQPTLEDTRVTKICAKQTSGNPSFSQTLSRQLSATLSASASETVKVKAFSASLIHLKYNNYNRAFSARTFLTVGYADGTVATFYTPYSAENNSRDIYTVAGRAYDDGVKPQAVRDYLDGVVWLDSDGGNETSAQTGKVFAPFAGSIQSMTAVSSSVDYCAEAPYRVSVESGDVIRLTAAENSGWLPSSVKKLMIDGMRYDFTLADDGASLVIAEPVIWTELY